MQHRFRLTRSTDFKRVRNHGKSFAHPLVVLIILPSTHEAVRVGVTAGRALGGAVERNRAKRLMREAVRPQIPSLRAGYDVILIARVSFLKADFREIQAVLHQLFERAGLFTGS